MEKVLLPRGQVSNEHNNRAICLGWPTHVTVTLFFFHNGSPASLRCVLEQDIFFLA